MIGEHRTSLESDLYTYTHHSIDELGSDLDWNTAYAIIKTLPLDSALARELQPEGTIWSSRLKTNYLLADIVDLLAGILYTVGRMAGGKPQKPKPIERPSTKKHKDHYGREALPVNELKSWLFKRK